MPKTKLPDGVSRIFRGSVTGTLCPAREDPTLPDGVMKIFEASLTAYLLTSLTQPPT